MTDPHARWTKQALEELVGTTETLTREFKSYRALVWETPGQRKEQIAEAAKDVAAMANEQGGEIIYGIEEDQEGTRRWAKRVEAGFEASHGVSREWFIQTMRAHINPLLTLEAVDVKLDGERFALVVVVPQATGVARQTDDLQFWRRDAQGVHHMTIQEILDVAQRLTRPVLALEIEHRMGQFVDGQSAVTSQAAFLITNPSAVTASFAVVTLGLNRRVNAVMNTDPDWRWVEREGDWKTLRAVVATGSSDQWSPLTPEFVLPLRPLTITISTPDQMKLPGQPPWNIGLARLDHDGGSRLYMVNLYVHAPLALRLNPNLDELREQLGRGAVIPSVFNVFNVLESA